MPVLDIKSTCNKLTPSQQSSRQCSPWCLSFNACLADFNGSYSFHAEAAPVLACGLGNFAAGFTAALTDSQDLVFGSLAAALSELDSLLASGVVSVADSALPVSELASEVAAFWLASAAGASSEGAASALASVAVGPALEPSGPVTPRQVVMGSGEQ